MSKKISISTLLIATLLCLPAAHAQQRKKSATAARTNPAANPTATPMVTPIPTPVELTAPTPLPPEPESRVEETPVPEHHVRHAEASSSDTEFLAGPFVSALALPRPLSAGIEARYGFIGVSGSYGFLPEITISNVKLKINGWDGKVRIYPFNGAFFLGVGYGSQTFNGSETEVINGQTTTASVAQDNTFIAPHIGWNWGSTTRGFFMGLELGVQLSLKHTTTFTSDANVTVQASQQYQDLRKDVLDKADQVGNTPLPMLTLIKIGYLF